MSSTGVEQTRFVQRVVVAASSASRSSSKDPPLWTRAPPQEGKSRKEGAKRMTKEAAKRS